MLFTKAQTLDGSFLTDKSAQHDAWTDIPTDTAVLIMEEDKARSYWLALSKGSDEGLYVGYGTTDQAHWSRLTNDQNIPGILLSEDETATFWKTHLRNLSQADSIQGTLKLLEALHQMRDKSAIQTDQITKKPLMVVTNSALRIYEAQMKSHKSTISVPPIWGKIDYSLHPPVHAALYGCTAVWSSVIRPDLVLVMQHQPEDERVGTVFSPVTGYSVPLVHDERGEPGKVITLKLDSSDLNCARQLPFIPSFLQGEESAEATARHVTKLYQAYQNHAPRLHKDLSTEDVGQQELVVIVPKSTGGYYAEEAGTSASGFGLKRLLSWG